ncbi:sensor histidine kinase [Micromonospora sp. HNM0581]|uniref:sensor histidine kinase n=1 Tax=Micromonospora sp. HNM0581 TaxID=2716341 RepID=UPI00146F3A6D|nr:sensor domain-containing protein [Micromonospora sp. HNM0581]NLU80025.1 sensor histidine kinase [Micromonospora sp. HNM0581]
MRSRTAWQAMALHPVGFLASAWPWRALLYLSSGVLAGALTMFLFVGVVTAGILTVVVLVGAGLLLAAALMGLPFARLERLRLRLVDLDGIQDPHRPPEQPGLRAWLCTRLTESATWRELILMVISLTALWWVDVAVLGLAFVVPALCISAPIDDPFAWPWAVLGGLLLLAAPYSLTAWAGARATLCRIVLAPRDAEVDPDLKEISESRARLLDAFEAERARIERDLHDGAQQRLVSLSVMLGLMALDVPENSPLQREIESAREQLALALADLRNLVRGLNPQVLTDNGLVAALEEVASRFPVPVSLDLRLAGRLPQPVETAAYYAVTEALANVAKHSRATQVELIGRHHADILVLQVRDNGVGGANPSAGTGLTGLADRLAVLNGRTRVSSPPGGPTLVMMEISCPFG